MAYDGSLKFDTKLVDSGFSEGITKLSSMAKKGLMAATGAMAGMSSYAIKVGADFEAGMSEVAAISGASAQDLEMLTDKAKEMGIQTKFSATEASEAMKYMAMAGWKAADMSDGISGIMNLAAASGEELASVSDIVTDALTAFGLQAKDSGHFADVLAKAASNSNTNVGMMGATFKYAAPLAGSLKYSVEDTAVAIGLMANAGIKGEQAGTALRGMLTRMIKPTDEVEAVMEKLGITIANSDGTVKPFSQTMQELRAAFADLTDEQKSQYAASLAGQEAMSGFLAIVNASESDFNKLTDAINHADGTAKEMADTMNDNLKGKITLLGSSLEGAGIAAYEKFERPLKKAVEGVIDNVNDLSREISSGSLSDSMDKVAEGFAAIVEAGLDLATGAIPLIIDGFAFLADHGKEIVSVLSAVGAAMAMQKTIVPAVTAIRTAMMAIDAYNVKLLACTLSGIKFSGSLTLGQAAVGLFTGKVTLATAATTAWDVACSALGGSIGVIITAVGALAVGLVALSLNMGNVDEELQRQTEMLEDNNEKWKQLKESQEEQLSADLSQIENVKKLKDELSYLTDENGKVKKGYESRAKFILGELNEALGTEYTMTDSVIGNYKELEGTIDKLIQKKRTKAILDSQEPLYQEAINKQMEEAIEIGKLSNEVQDKTNRKKEVENELIKQYGKNFALGAATAKDARLDEYNDLNTSITEKTKLLDGFQKSYEQHTNTVLTYENNMVLAASDNAEDWARIQTGNIAVADSTQEEKEKILKEDLVGLQVYYNDLLDRQKKGDKRVTESAIKEAKKRIEDKQAEIDAITSTIAGGEKKVYNASKKVSEAGVKGAEEGSKGFSEIGSNNLTGFINGMVSIASLTKVRVAASTMAETAIEAAKKTLDEHSPSRVFRDDVGYMGGAGMAIGFDKSQGLVKKSVTAMAQVAINQAKRMHPLMEKGMSLDFSGSFSAMRSVAEHQMSDLSPSFSSNIYHTYSNSDKEAIDYNKLGKATAEAIAKEGIAVKFNNREFGRISKEWM